MNIAELKQQALIEIYEDWQSKDRLTLSKCEPLPILCSMFKSLDYYVQHNLLSYPYDKVDNADLRDLEYHINLYVLEDNK